MKAVVLLSGGMDSVTTLAIARSRGFECHALSIAYGQRHASELSAAAEAARRFGVAEHRVMSVSLEAYAGSALTNHSLAVPESATEGIPVTYVPARNALFLSLALGWSETLGARDIFIGVNARDYSGYPDCRPEFIAAFESMAALATRAGVCGDGAPFKVHTPLIDLEKSAIIQQGVALGVDYANTVSCYQADPQGRACRHCDACRLRRAGFQSAGIADPTRYITG